ncbi:cytochrome d ubiquinol oxidase subunit II [Kocuria rosea]|uniref:cytochrome d ubiquinol oxidase subunit II n=1 Tax=Kocuria rosea TaxID=1275 RepID=UPI000DFB13B4|nr:Cytochrome d ubiquinol oxidase subunit 2 [Kocuria rosea]
MELLPTLWFIAIAVLWTGFILLDGFDLGVGMLMLISTRDERQRRQMLNTIGPVWDGNEVWLITAAAGLFAAFPDWYASLFSALYVPFVFVLVGLIFRAVSIEYRGKVHSDRWRRWVDRALGTGSFLVAFGLGAALALTTTGLPLNANGDRVGGAFAWFTRAARAGAVGFCLVHAAAFLEPRARPVVPPGSSPFGPAGAGAAPVLAVQSPHTAWTWPPVPRRRRALRVDQRPPGPGRPRLRRLRRTAVLRPHLIFANVYPVVCPPRSTPPPPDGGQRLQQRLHPGVMTSWRPSACPR